jgi:hypothetical protein
MPNKTYLAPKGYLLHCTEYFVTILPTYLSSGSTDVSSLCFRQKLRQGPTSEAHGSTPPFSLTHPYFIGRLPMYTLYTVPSTDLGTPASLPYRTPITKNPYGARYVYSDA